MRIELRLYPNLQSSESESLGIFYSLEEAWNEAYKITTFSSHTLRDFFTLDLSNETDNRI